MLLKNKTVVLAGGTGSVGEGMAESLLMEGATLVVPFRSLHKEHSLIEFLGTHHSGNLVTIPADVSDQEEAERFRDAVLSDFGYVDIAIASLGGWIEGYDIADMPIEQWSSLIQNNLTSHFLFARTMIPLLRSQNDGLYVNINGGAQDMVLPKAGGMTIISSAQNRMTEVLFEEAKTRNYRVRSVAAYTPVITRANISKADASWISAQQIGRYIAKLYHGQIKDDPITHKLGT